MKATEQTIYNQLKTSIQEKRLISFIYTDTKTGKQDFKMVEPFQIGIHRTTSNAILSAWCIPVGEQLNKDKADWRIYLLTAISNITTLTTTFNGDRTGFKAESNGIMKEILLSITD